MRKRLKSAFFSAFLCVGVPILGHSATTTPRMGLTTPAFGDNNWDVQLRNNNSIIDASACVQGLTNTFTAVNTFTQPLALNQTQLQFYDASLGRYVGFQAPATVTTTLWTLPSADGVNGQCLTTNGGGTLSFTTVGGGGGGGSSLAVTTGTSSGFNTVQSSPTVVINAEGTQFNVNLKGGATAYMSLNQSSVTLMGNTFNQASKLLQLNGSAQLPALDGSLLTGIVFNGVLAGGATSYWNAPSTATFVDNFGISASSVVASSVTISLLNSGQCVQTGAGGILGTSGNACNAGFGANTYVQYDNNGVLGGSSLETINSSSITFQSVSSATYTGFSTMTLTSMYFDGSTSTMTFSSGTITSLSATNEIATNLYGSGTGVNGSINFYDNQSDLNNICTFNQNGFGCQFGGSVAPPGSPIEGKTTNGVNSTAILGTVSGSALYAVKGNASANNSMGIQGNFNPIGNMTGYGIQGITAAGGASATEYAGYFNGVGSAGATIYGLYSSATGGGNNYGLYVAAGTSTFVNSSGPYEIVSTSSTTPSNFYHVTVSTNGALGFFSLPKASIGLIIPNKAGEAFYCSDCATVSMCISTGTAQGAFGLITNKGSACQ